MARVRAPAISKKRSFSPDDSSSASSSDHSASTDPSSDEPSLPTERRPSAFQMTDGISPTRNVRFGPEQGPTGSRGYDRALSPSRSALREANFADTMMADQQLRTEMDIDDPIPARRPSSSKRAKTNAGGSRKASTTGKGSGGLLTPPITGVDGTKGKSKARPAASRKNDLPTPPLSPVDGVNFSNDDVVCESVHQFRDMVGDFAATAPGMTCGPEQRSLFLQAFMTKENAELLRYIGCLSLAGTKGRVSWEELFADGDCRQSLVFGIVGRALKEHIFSALWFGGSEVQRNALEKLERKQVEQDGFHRTVERARVVEGYTSQLEVGARSKCYKEAVIKVSAQLEHMLMPLWALVDSSKPCWRSIKAIVERAAELSRAIRRTRDVVFYWPPTFKDEEFVPGRMECRNISKMISESPYEKTHQDGHDRAVLNAGSEDRNEAIVEIVCFPGVVAYRKGGGALADKELGNDAVENSRAPPDVQHLRAHEVVSKDSGYRSRVICKAVVHLKWGRQRLLTKEAGTSAHLDATRDGTEQKYVDDYKGTVELYDLYRKEVK